MHSEHNVWLNTLDIIYHEAMQRDFMNNVLSCLASLQSESKQRPGNRLHSDNLPHLANINHAEILTFDPNQVVSQQLPAEETEENCSIPSAGSNVGVGGRSMIIPNQNTTDGLLPCLGKIKNVDNLSSKEVEVGAGLSPLAQTIREHFNKENTRHNKLSSCYRLIGEQAISLARFSFRLLDALTTEAETQPQKCKQLIILASCVNF